MKIYNYEYWLQYLIYESKLNDVYLEVSEQKAVNIFNKIEDKLRRVKAELSISETDKIIKTELDKEVDKHIKSMDVSSELKIKFILNEYGNIMCSIVKMDYQAIVSLKSHGDTVEYLILKNNERYEGVFTISDFLEDYHPEKLHEIVDKKFDSILIKNSSYNEVEISLCQKLSDIKEGKSKLGIDLEYRYGGH